MSAPGHEDWIDPGHLGGRWRSAILRSPVGLTVLGVAACSVALSVAGFFALSRALELPRTQHFSYYLAIAIVIPVFVSVPISWVIVRLLREVDVARRLAERLASNDALTGLLNRRRFAELSRRELGLALRTGTPLTALLIDLYDFKRVNDRLGHAEGDRLLEATARRILGALRSTDLASRWGGEELRCCCRALASMTASPSRSASCSRCASLTTATRAPPRSAWRGPRARARASTH